jgi:hypothetical protein
VFYKRQYSLPTTASCLPALLLPNNMGKFESSRYIKIKLAIYYSKEQVKSCDQSQDLISEKMETSKYDLKQFLVGDNSRMQSF